MILQVILDIAKGTKTIINVEPSGTMINDVVNVTTDDVADDAPIDESTDGGGMVKFFPSGAKEVLSYERSDISGEDAVGSNNTLIDLVGYYAPSQCYSLLNDNVKMGTFTGGSGDVIMGMMPQLYSIMLSESNEDSIRQQFGILSTSSYYSTIIDNINTKSYRPSARSCVTLNSISKNKSPQSLTIFAQGQVPDHLTTFEEGGVTGVKYISSGYDVNYYNQTVIPYIATSSSTSEHFTPTQDAAKDNDGAGGYTEEMFITNINNLSYLNYLYLGSDPLQWGTNKSTKMTSKSMVNLENFIVLAVNNRNNQFQSAIICNKGSGIHDVWHWESNGQTYLYTNNDNKTFYRLTAMTKSRWEQCIVGDLNGSPILYPCTKGAGALSGLTTLISLMDTGLRQQMIEQAPIVEGSAASSYYTKQGAKMVPLTELLAKDVTLHDITSYINAGTNSPRLERSTTRCVPLGRNMSLRTMHSERIGEITQDYDSKDFVGGGIQMKTYTHPTHIERATAGNGRTAKNVGYGNAVYASQGDIQLVADNFLAQNENMGGFSVNFKGVASIGDFEKSLDLTSYILDRVTLDLAKNTTSFTGRAEII